MLCTQPILLYTVNNFFRKMRKRVRFCAESFFVFLYLCTVLSPSFAAATKNERTVRTNQAVVKNPYGKYRNEFIQFAMTLRGKPYKLGAQGPDAFDCSGFLNYAARMSLKKYSLKIKKFPRRAADIYKKVLHISAEEKEPGDLIFFSSNGKISHVGIYVGRYKDINPDNGKNRLDGRIVFLSATSDGPERGVVLSAVDEPYWKSHFYGYGRFLKSSKEIQWQKKALNGL